MKRTFLEYYGKRTKLSLHLIGVLIAASIPCTNAWASDQPVDITCDNKAPKIAKKSAALSDHSTQTKKSSRSSSSRDKKKAAKLSAPSGNQAANLAMPVEKLSPSPRTQNMTEAETNRLDWRLMEAFTRDTMLLTSTEAEQAGRVLKPLQDNTLLNPGDLFIGIAPGLASGQRVSLVKPGSPLRAGQSPDILGFASEYIGLAEVVQSGKISTFRLIHGKQDVDAGMWIVPQVPETYVGITPKAAPPKLLGEVLAVLGVYPVAANNAVIAISLPEDSPSSSVYDRGTLLSLIQPGQTIRLPEFGKQPFELPDRVAGNAIIVASRGRIALAYVRHASGEIRVGSPVFGAALDP